MADPKSSAKGFDASISCCQYALIYSFIFFSIYYHCIISIHIVAIHLFFFFSSRLPLNMNTKMLGVK